MRAILDRLAVLDVRVSVTPNRRLALTPKHRLTPDLIATIRVHREEIIRHLVRTSDAEVRIRAWLAHTRETDPGILDEVLGKCAADPVALAYFMTRATEVPPVRRVLGWTVHGVEVVTKGTADA